MSMVGAGRLIAIAMMSGAALGAAGPASAHHSFAMFDQQHRIQVQGVVKSWQFTNPHSWLELIIVKNGQYILYSVECGPPVTLIRKGWSKDSFHQGDKVTVTVAPLKDGGDGGSMVKATANGLTLVQ
jgi:Family of unknown function (DUF6152)